MQIHRTIKRTVDANQRNQLNMLKRIEELEIEKDYNMIFKLAVRVSLICNLN